MPRENGSKNKMAQNPQGSALGPNARGAFKCRGVAGRVIPKTATAKGKPCHQGSPQTSPSPRGQTKNIG